MLLCGATGTITVWFARQRTFRHTLITLPSPSDVLLMLGAVLICGCFFAGQSVAYRGILLMLALPGLLTLARNPTDQRSRRISRWTIAAILLVMWRLTVIQALAAHGLQNWHAEDGGGTAVAAAVWIGFELAWWWIVSVLLAILLAFMLDSPTGQRVIALIGWPRLER